MEHYRVLVVDDDTSQRELLREVLQSATDRFQVLEASNGLDALKMLGQHTVDAVLVDKRMPIMDGDELCTRIRVTLSQPFLPVLMVTGSPSPDELTQSFAAGATDFIYKPYRSLELIARLTSAVTRKRLIDQLDRAENVMFTLARMVEAKDLTTGDHCTRLMHMGMVFGRALGLSSHELDALHKGGILHDIGKLGIPDSILLKQGPLSEEEWAVMRTHTVIGGHLCDGLQSMRKVVPIIVHHHERWDGSGYPQGLSGEAIPLLARVFQLVDIYDALASVRPYKKEMTQEEIVTVLRDEVAKGWRDPRLCEEFLTLVHNEPAILTVPNQRTRTRDEKMYGDILSTGAIDWNRDRQYRKA